MLSWKQCALPVITTMATVHYVPKCMSCHKAIVVITGRAHYFHDNIYIYIYIYIYFFFVPSSFLDLIKVSLFWFFRWFENFLCFKAPFYGYGSTVSMLQSRLDSLKQWRQGQVPSLIWFSNQKENEAIRPRHTLIQIAFFKTLKTRSKFVSFLIFAFWYKLLTTMKTRKTTK